MYMLLDTNIFISLINDPNEEYLINKLKWLIDSGQTDLLVPEVLMKEWLKKKENAIVKLQNNIKEIQTRTQNKLLSYDLENQIEILKEKAKQVELLLANGIQIKHSNAVKILTTDRRTENLPPFRPGNTTSFNDGLIFFTAIEYLKKKKAEEYCFITRDKDFREGGKPTADLDPELRYPFLDVHFSPSLEKTIRTLQALGKLRLESRQDEAEQKALIRVIPQKDKNLLDYLYEVLRLSHQKMRMIPPDIFCRIHPFRVSNNRYNYTYFSHYTLHSNNKDLIEFFSDVDIERHKFKNGSAFRNTKSNLIKLKFILKALNKQLIYSINNIGADKTVNIKPERNRKCNCTRCLYAKLSWADFLKEDYSSDDTLTLYFIYYKLGLYNLAFKGYYDCYLKARAENNKIFAYQLQFLLKWLGHHIFSASDSDISKIKTEIEKWDLEREYFSFHNSSPLDREIARFFQNGNPLRSFQISIRDSADKIRSHYISQLYGSHSSNEHYWTLSSEFSVFIEFTLANAMAYTRYNEFSAICNDFAEGVMFSYSLNEYQPNRLQNFDDFILHSLLSYGRADEIIKFYTRYIKQDIHYEKKNGSFKQIVGNFLDNGPGLIEQLEKTNAWQGSVHFYQMYWNLLLLLALVKFDNKFVIACFDKILPFLTIIPKRETSKLNHLASFIQARGRILGEERTKLLFNLCLENPDMHKDGLFDAFATLARKNSFHLINTEKEFESFCLSFLEKCSKCNQYHHNILFSGYQTLSPEFKERLSKLIVDKLTAEQDFTLYYFSSLQDIINYRLFFNDYLSLFQAPKKEKRHPFFDLDGELTFRSLNELMNLVFKEKEQLPESFITRMCGISDYYDWLLGMEDFDYVKFKPLWITQYPTSYYLEKAFSIPKVRKKVRIFLKKNHQPVLSNLYSQYVRPN